MSFFRFVLAPVALASVLLCTAAPRPLADYGKLPLAFEPNVGQGDAASQYLGRGGGYSIGLQPSGVQLSTRGRGKNAPSFTFIRFAGANPASRANATDPLQGKVNYFLGSNPRNWKKDVPTYGRVEYLGVYPGINVAYYGTQGRLEYDFVVAPGANPSLIRMKVSGAGGAHLKLDGDLAIGELRQHKPVAYQLLADGRRNPVACQYVLKAGEASLLLGVYDHSRTLVIDPVLSYSTYLGGSGNESVMSLKVDALGNLYAAGFTTSANFPKPGALQSAYGGASSPAQYVQLGDAFVSKFNAAGTALIYSTYLGGSGDDAASTLAIDAQGNAYLGGATTSVNFPTTAGAIQRTYGGTGNDGFYDSGDGFVAKIGASGNQLLYSTYLGGTLNDTVWAIAVDANGNAIVGGNTMSANFPTTANAISRQYRGNAAGLSTFTTGDGFVAILNPTATALTYSTYLGGRDDDQVKGLALDGQGNIFVCGFTYSPNFPTTPGAYQTTFKGVETLNDYNAAAGDAFVTKINAQGALVYSTFLGGTYRDSAWAIAVDATGSAYVTGRTSSSNFPTTPGAPQTTYKGKEGFGSTGDLYLGDAFITKLNPGGSALIYSTYLGGAGDESGTDIAVDAAGNAYVSGFTTSPGFPVTTDALQPTNAGSGGQGIVGRPGDALNTGDAFLVKLGPTGSLLYSSFFGGSADDAAMALALDSIGNVYIGGSTLSQNLKTSPGALQASYGGTGSIFPRGDGFVAKFDFGGTLPATPSKLNVIAGFIASGAPGAVLSAPFTVEVVDARGAVLSGVTVAFTATNASVNPASAVTNAQGRASTTVTLGSTAGTGQVTAAVSGVPSASLPLTITAAVTGPVVNAVVNGASFTNRIAPGSWITIFSSNALAQTIANTVPLPKTLGGVRILVNGNPIPLYLTSPTQINAQLPYEVAAGTAQLVLEINSVSSAPAAFPVQASAPGIFVFGDNRAVVQNVAPDATLTVNTSANPIPAGDSIIAYFTGQGALDNPVPSGDIAPLAGPLSRPMLPYSATLGGAPLIVDFLGMTPGQIALVQANLRVPRDLAPGDYPLVVTIGGVPSNGPMISVTGPRP